MLRKESETFGKIRRQGALRLSLSLVESFKRASTGYWKRSSLQHFGRDFLPDFRFASELYFLAGLVISIMPLSFKDYQRGVQLL